MPRTESSYQNQLLSPLYEIKEYVILFNIPFEDIVYISRITKYYSQIKTNEEDLQRCCFGRHWKFCCSS